MPRSLSQPFTKSQQADLNQLRWGSRKVGEFRTPVNSIKFISKLLHLKPNQVSRALSEIDKEVPPGIDVESSSTRRDREGRVASQKQATKNAELDFLAKAENLKRHASMTLQ
jgi:hypothetical protein